MSAAVAAVVPNTLYHYTCVDHGEPGIMESKALLPFRQPILGQHLVWLTDMDTPNAWALGLTNTTLCCDRTQVRVTVNTYNVRDAHGIRPWWAYARRMNHVLRDVLEATGLPMHWWVTDLIVPIEDITRTAELRGRKTHV